MDEQYVISSVSSSLILKLHIYEQRLYHNKQLMSQQKLVGPNIEFPVNKSDFEEIDHDALCLVCLRAVITSSIFSGEKHATKRR